MRDADDYKAQITALLPPGKLWRGLLATPVFDRLLAAIAEEFARVDQRTDALLSECDPNSTMELLDDWEAWAGLPDICTGVLPTAAQRHNALLSRLTTVGGQSRSYFIDLAARLGYAVTITEFRPLTCETACDEPVYDAEWWFTWRVNAPGTTIIESSCESPCDEPIRIWGNDSLECAIRALAPAHTNVLFSYGG